MNQIMERSAREMMAPSEFLKNSAMTMNKKTDFDVAEHVEYDPLTGQFRKVEKKTQPEESPFWTKMGQPKKQPPPLEDDIKKKY